MRLIDADNVEALVRDARKNLPKDSSDFFTRDNMLLNFEQILNLEPTVDTMGSDVLKSVKEIGGYTPEEMIAMYDDYERMAKEWEAYAGTGLTPEEIAHAKDLLSAERDGQLYTVHDVAVILASAIGDDCACNINSNDEWLPQVCELQEACPHPVGVACWEQYLKHRAEAEKALGKEQ